MRQQIGRFLGLVIVTVFAVAVAVMVTTGSWGRTAPGTDDGGKRIMPKTPVSVTKVELESIEITDSYSGMIRPRERFSLGFEISGRVVALGPNAAGDPLDEGDRVSEGQVLARLDDRVLRSRLEEAKAQVEEAKAQLDQARAQIKQANARREQAQSDLARSRELKQSGNRMISETDYQDHVTRLAVADAGVSLAQAQLAAAQAQLGIAEAQLPTAKKNFEDATLRCPVAGVVSKRLINAGESVGAHQAVMEVIQVEEVLLVVGVPEAYVGAIQLGQAVYVELLARDRFRRERPRTQGRVYQVAEAADQTTGLFEVEIVLPNADGAWKPGLIALARIVLKEVQGFRVAATSVVFRDDKTFLFTAEKDGAPLFEAGQSGKANRLELNDWIEQDSDLILSELGPKQRAVVTRGQHRLVQDREVIVVQLDADDLPEMDSKPRLRSPASIAGSE